MLVNEILFSIYLHIKCKKRKERHHSLSCLFFLRVDGNCTCSVNTVFLNVHHYHDSRLKISILQVSKSPLSHLFFFLNWQQSFWRVSVLPLVSVTKAPRASQANTNCHGNMTFCHWHVIERKFMSLELLSNLTQMANIPPLFLSLSWMCLNEVMRNICTNVNDV